MTLTHAINFIERPVWQRLLASLTFVASALAITQLMWVFFDRPISAPLFLGAIILSGWLCGWRIGILAAMLSAIIIDFFFIPPFHYFVGDFDEIARLVVFTLEGGICCWLIEVRRRAVSEMRRTEEQLRALTSYQQTLREAEQKRISLEIHDELGQALTGLKMEVHLLNRNVVDHGKKPDTGFIAEKLSDLSGQIDDTISTIRRIATELRPSVLDDFGLIAAIEWQAQEFSRKSGVDCIVDSSFDSLDVAPEESTVVFRIVQEALTNVTRHAGAKCVNIAIGRTDGNITVTVSDDGVGIDLNAARQSPSLGILGMRERARLIGATLDFESENGTSIQLTLPKTQFAQAGDLV